MELGTWINPIYGVIALILMFVLIPFERIKQLWPVGLIALLLLFISQQIAFSLGFLKYNKGWIILYGIPLFQYLWAFCAGVILMHYMKKEWIKKLPRILALVVINEILVSIAMSLDALSFLKGFNIFYDFILTFVTFSLGVWIAEGLFKNRIYSGETRNLI